jgi:hypothetical protein
MVASTQSPTVITLASRGEGIPESIDLHNRVESALIATGHLHGRNLRFEVAEDVVVLKGVVRSYFLKQVAQEALRAVLGGLRLSNELEVARG